MVSLSVVRAGTILEDHFTEATKSGRRMPENRSARKVADGMATCVQDDALFAKNSNHGPVIWYDTKFADGTVRFTFRPEKARMVVFTANSGNAHAFRFTVAKSGLRVLAYPIGSDAHKAEMLMPENEKGPTLVDGQWTEAVVTFAGDEATLTIGDFTKTFKHPAIAQEKTLLGLGFSYGTFSVKDVTVETP